MTIAALTIRGGRIHAVLRCHGSGQCRVRLSARSGSRVIGAGGVTLRGNRNTAVTLPIRSQGRHPVTLSVLSSWNGYPAAVTATT